MSWAKMLDARYSTLPYCCGVYEAGDFGVDEYADVVSKTPKGLVGELVEAAEGRPIIFNFVRQRIGNGWEFSGDPLTLPLAEEYEYEVLRKYVSKHEDALHVAEFINPNSGNMVDSWILLSNLRKE